MAKTLNLGNSTSQVDVNLSGSLFLNSPSYGTSLPAEGTEGQVFFLLDAGAGASNSKFLPSGGAQGNILVKASDNNYDVEWSDTIEGSLYVTEGVFGAVWNDYAEFRQLKEKTEKIPYGRCVCENGDDTMSISKERMQAAPAIVSDTYGFAIGETELAKLPIAVSGRVLVFPEGKRENYHAGDVVCAGPNGTVSKMTREEIKEYPDRIVGIVSAIPSYKNWGTKNIEVNGRIWIKVV